MKFSKMVDLFLAGMINLFAKDLNMPKSKLETNPNCSEAFQVRLVVLFVRPISLKLCVIVTMGKECSYHNVVVIASLVKSFLHFENLNDLTIIVDLWRINEQTSCAHIKGFL